MRKKVQQMKTCIRSSAQKVCLFARRRQTKPVQASSSPPEITVKTLVAGVEDDGSYAEDVSGISVMDNGKQKTLMLPLTLEMAQRMAKALKQESCVNRVVDREDFELSRLERRIEGFDLQLEEKRKNLLELEAKQKQAPTAQLHDALYEAREEIAAIESRKAECVKLDSEAQTRQAKVLQQQRCDNYQLFEMLRPLFANSGLLPPDRQDEGDVAESHENADAADQDQAPQALASDAEAAEAASSIDADASSIDNATWRLQLQNAAISRFLGARSLLRMVMDGCEAHEEYEEWIAQKKALGQDVVPDEGAAPVLFRTREETDQDVAEAAQAVDAAKAFARLIGHPLDDHDDESGKSTASDGADAASHFSRAES